MSREILHGLLREELGYDGLVMTDALEMRAISATPWEWRRGRCGRSRPAPTRSAWGTTCSRTRSSACATRLSAPCAPADRGVASRRGRRAGSPGVGVGIASTCVRVGELRRGCRPSCRAARAPGQRVSARSHVHRSSSSSSPSRAWPPAACRKARATGSASVVPEAEVVRVQQGTVATCSRSSNGRQLVDPRARRAPPCLGARRRRGARRPRSTTRSSSSSASRTGDRRGATAYVITNGAGRVNVEAAAERLSARTRSR